MNKAQENKLQRFVNDRATATAVYQFLLDAFLKPKNQDSVEVMAAERISINVLQLAWKELEKYANKQEIEPVEQTQQAL